MNKNNIVRIMNKSRSKQTSLSSFLAVAAEKWNQFPNEEKVIDRKIIATVLSTAALIIQSYINTMLDNAWC